MNNKTIAVMISLLLCLLFLTGCEQTTETTQKAVQETETMINNVTETVKEETSNIVNKTQESASDATEGVKVQAVELLDASKATAGDTVEKAKETLALSPIDENE